MWRCLFVWSVCLKREEGGSLIPDREPRVNEKIRAKEVRLVDPEGGQIGIKTIDEARWLAGQLGFDLVWFGLFVLMTFEMAGTTPPFGLLLYVMLGVAPKGTTLFQVAGAAFPYLVCDAILIMILIFYPSLALWLPSLM